MGWLSGKFSKRELQKALMRPVSAEDLGTPTVPVPFGPKYDAAAKRISGLMEEVAQTAEKMDTPEYQITEARNRYYRLLDDNPDTLWLNDQVDNALRKMHQFLEKAGADLSALDPTGESSIKDIEKILQQAVKQRYIDTARCYYNTLQRTDIKFTDAFFSQNENRMREYLRRGNGDLSDLDRNGEESSEDIEASLITLRQTATNRYDYSTSQPTIPSFLSRFFK